jgi:hypothetical protein
MRRLVQFALAAALLFATWCAQATLIEWTLHDVSTDVGEAVTGFFLFDPATAVNPSIWEIAGAGNSQSVDNPRSSVSFSAGQTRLHFSTSFLDAGDDVELRFDGKLPLEGGLVPVAVGSYTELHAATLGIFRHHPIISGTVTGVLIPEPAQYAFFGLGVVLLVLHRISRS